MVRWCLVGLVLAFGAIATAAEPLRFRWQAGQELTYTSEQITTVVETTVETGGPVTTPTATRLALTRRWAVRQVDADGSATLELKILSLKQQIARPGPRDRNGNPTVDRTVIDSNTPEGREQLAAILDGPFAVVKVNNRGELLEVLAGPGERLRAELPFRLILPEQDVPPGNTWVRPFGITLPPPLGTGEPYAAIQTCSLKGDQAGTAVIGIKTTLKTNPADPAERIALLPFLWEGEVNFSRQHGRYLGATLSIKQTIANHKGEGSKFEYESKFTEKLVERP